LPRRWGWGKIRPSMDTEKPHILVVDDDEANRDLLGRRLERKGFRVTVAEGGRQALGLLAGGAADLVVLDVMMPGMSGLQVLKVIRETPELAELPVILATARFESQDVVDGLDSGADDYITKPIDFPVLLARIEVLLRARKSPSAQAAREPSPGSVDVGMVIAGQYRLDRELGSGNIGTVFAARDLKLCRDVAVKVLKGSVASDPQAVERFQREAVASCRVRHPNAVTVYDFAVSPSGLPYLVMELLQGWTVDALLAVEERLPPARCAGILVPVCHALQEVHSAGMVHRDLKPANLYLETVGGRETVKVLDFGIAKLVEASASEAALTIEGMVLGTPAYMAPERFGPAPVDPKADIYSLGVILYQMLEGRRPFVPTGPDLVAFAMMHATAPPPPLVAAREEAGPGLAALIEDALAKDPARRPTAAEFARRLLESVPSTGGAR